MRALAARQNDDRPIPYTRADWLDVALSVLVEDGIEAVQVTRLARALDPGAGRPNCGPDLHFRDPGP